MRVERFLFSEWGERVRSVLQCCVVLVSGVLGARACSSRAVVRTSSVSAVPEHKGLAKYFIKNRECYNDVFGVRSRCGVESESTN